MTANAPVTVYQAEWCPFSSRVRQKLTELGVPYLAMPVPPDREDRTEMRDAVGTDSIPAVLLADGIVLGGETAEIVAELGRRFPEGPHADGHRRQAAAHA